MASMPNLVTTVMTYQPHRLSEHLIIKQHTFPKLFNKVGSAFLLIGMIGLFICAQILGIYIFTPLVLDDEAMQVPEILATGSFHGTVISYTMILTLAVLAILIFLVVKFRIYRVVKRSKKADLTEHDNGHNYHDSIELTKPSVADYLGLHTFSAKVAWAMILLWVIFLLVSEYFTQLLDKNPSAFVDNLYYTAEPRWLLIVAMVVVVPIYEELVFRGIIWSALQEQLGGKKGVILASIVTSVIFAAIHLQYDLYEMTVIFTLAILLSYSRYKSGSLCLPILIHIINNGIAMWQYLYYLG